MSNTRNWPNIAAHSMTIGGKHTFTDWSLLPREIPVFAQAKPKLDYQSVPGASGALDYTDVLSGQMAYEDREGSFSFLVLPDTTWENARSAIANFLAGQKMNCILDDDPAYYYSGRFWVNEAQSNKGYGIIVISYHVEPFKHYINHSGSIDWLWDQDSDTIIYYGRFAVSTSRTMNLINPTTSAITPKFICSAAMTATKGGTDYSLPQGSTTTPGFTLAPGDNEITFAGTGTVLADYAPEVSL